MHPYGTPVGTEWHNGRLCNVYKDPYCTDSQQENTFFVDYNFPIEMAEDSRAADLGIIDEGDEVLLVREQYSIAGSTLVDCCWR